MKVLHIWDVAGVGSIIAKYMDRLYGTESCVVMRRSQNVFNFEIYGEVWDTGGKMFLLKSLIKAKDYDIVFVHSLHFLLPTLRLFYKNKKLALYCHGDDVRDKWNKLKYYCSRANFIFVSTEDLLEGSPKNVVYIPNPIDTEIFKKRRGITLPKTALHFSYGADDIAESIAKKFGLTLTIYDRNRNPIPHKDLPKLFSQYEYYVEVKRNLTNGKIIHTLSKTALEALACGCKVITWDGKIIDELPASHYPENVVKKIWENINY